MPCANNPMMDSCRSLIVELKEYFDTLPTFRHFLLDIKKAAFNAAFLNFEN